MPLTLLNTRLGGKQQGKKHLSLPELGCHWTIKQCGLCLLTKWDCVHNQAASWFHPADSGLQTKRTHVTRCMLPRRLARVRMSFSISVYISSSEKRPMPWPNISLFTIPLVRWHRIHFSKSLKGPKSETIFCVSWRFSTHWQYVKVLEGYKNKLQWCNTQTAHSSPCKGSHKG